MRKLIIIGFALIVILGIVFLMARQKNKPQPVLPVATPNIPESMERKSFIKNMDWVPLYNQLPTGSPLTTKIEATKKFSFDNKSFASLTDKGLTISERGDQIKQEVSFEKTTKEGQFVWLTNDYLLLVEKQNQEDLGIIDWVYLVAKESGKKEALVGSFPMVNRLDLSFEPKLYEGGHVVVFLDNDKNYWALSLKF
jgi:hypothetical protein